MNLGNQLKRIRRFLRDPDGNLWTRPLLMNLFNDAQREIQMKTKVLEDVTALRVPPLYHCSYLYDWEWPYLPSNQTQFYKAFKDVQQADYVVTCNFEIQINSSGDVTDEGVHFTQPWEAFVGESPGDQVKIRFPSNFHTAKLLAYDRNPIDYITKKEIQRQDSSYLIRTGLTQAYYREDDLDNSFIPYPLPTTIDWDDLDEVASNADFLFTHDWESIYLSGTGSQFTVNDSTNSIDYIFTWEGGTPAQDLQGHGMWLFEGFYKTDGMITSVSTDTNSNDVGLISYRTGSMESQNLGIAVDVIDMTNQFVLIYQLIPTELVTEDQESDFPIFLRKYIEQHALSRAYRVNNDGRIKSLSDYWDYRSTISLEAIKKYKSKRRQDRDYQLTIKQVPARINQRLPRLPSTYPADR